MLSEATFGDKRSWQRQSEHRFNMGNAEAVIGIFVVNTQSPNYVKSIENEGDCLQHTPR